jgi:hypothetical protein
MQAQFGFSDEEILSEEFVLSEEEIWAEFQKQCEVAAERKLILRETLRIAAKAFCRMKQRANPESFWSGRATLDH